MKKKETGEHRNARFKTGKGFMCWLEEAGTGKKKKNGMTDDLQATRHTQGKGGRGGSERDHGLGATRL